MRIILALILAAALVFAPHEAHGQTPVRPPWANALDALMARQMAAMRVPGAQVAVVEEGRLVYAAGYGVADIQSARRVTTDTLFQVGSVTKTVTGALVAQLAADGVLDLHAPISRYVPELVNRRVGAATTHQLITHTAGWADAAEPFGRTDDAALGESMTRVDDDMLLTEPGRVFSYSNPGFAMAGFVAERAAREPFVALVDRVVLRKVGMGKATFRPLVAMTYDFSQGHVPGADRALSVQRPTPGNSAEYPGGFLYATTTDLAQLGIALMADGMRDGERVLASAAVRSMTTGTLPIPGTPANTTGYGLQIDTVGGLRVWRKFGRVSGFQSELSMWPDRRLAIAISTNSDADLARATNLLAAQVIAGIALPEAAAAGPAMSPAQRADLLGVYRIGKDGTAEIFESEGKLQWRGRRGVYPITVVDAGKLSVQLPGGPQDTHILYHTDGRVLYLHSRSRTYVRQR